MGIGRASALILAAFALLCPVTHAGGFGVVSVGGEANAMGGAFRGVADNWTAAYYNPAGYAGIKDNLIGGDYNFVHWRNEITPNYRWDLENKLYETGITNDIQVFNRHDFNSTPIGGIVLKVPLFGESTIGFSAYQPFDYHVHWEMYEQVLAYNDSLRIPQNQFENDFDVATFQATIAKTFKDGKLALGLGLEVNRVSLYYSNVAFRDNPYLEIDPNWEGADRPFDKILQWSENSASGYGLGVRLGAMFKASEKMNVGASIHLPGKVGLTGDGNVNYILPKLAHPIGQGGSPTNLLTSGGKVIDSSLMEVDVTLPGSFGLGLAYKFSEKFQLSADVAYTMWSQFEGFDFEYTEHKGFRGAADSASYLDGQNNRVYYLRDFFQTEPDAPVEWDDALTLAGGFKFAYNPNLELMGGVSWDQSPATSNNLQTPLAIDLGEKLGIHGGITVHVQEWELTFSTSYIKHPEEDVSEFVDLNNDGLFDSFPGSYKAETYLTTFSFNYRF